MTTTWFITGAGRGLGRDLVRAAAGAGIRLSPQFGDPTNLRGRTGEHVDQLLLLPLDVTNSHQARAAVEQAQERFGRIDILVNNAGYGQLGWFENVDDEAVRRQFEVNLFGAMNVTRAVLPVMRAQRSGHVITISSIAGIISVPGGSIYSASKFAVEGWMEGLSGELQPLGIRSTVVEPGFFRTDFLDPSSAMRGSSTVADYADAQEQFYATSTEMNHRQLGDPVKMGALLMRLISMDDPPFRIAAGSDAAHVIASKAEQIRSNVEHWRDLSVSTDR